MPSEHRLHPASVFFLLASQLKNFVLPGVLVLLGAGRAGRDWEPWLMLFLIPNTIFAFLQYISFRYRYDEHEMVIRKGVIFRSERHVPYARIQNLDAVQNVVHRMVGVVEVRVQTGGGSEPEAVMSVIPLAQFQDMRARVFERGGSLSAAASTNAEVRQTADLTTSPLLQLSIRDLMIAGFIENRGMVVIAAGFGLLWEFGGIDPVFERIFGEAESGRGMIRNVLAAIGGVDVLDPRRLAMGVVAFAGLLLFIRILSMGLAVVRLYGFELRRDGEDLRTEFGLITRIVATIPLRRIQTLTIHEGPLHRRFHRVAVKVETAGGEGQKAAATERAWLAPIIQPEHLSRLLAEVLPELDLAALEWQALHPKAFRRVLRGGLMFWLPISVFVGVWLDFGLRFEIGLVTGWTPVLMLLVAAWCLVAARKFVRHASWSVGDQVVVFRRGWLWKRTTVARFAKIQAVALHESPFDRRWAMARVAVDTAGADTGSDRVTIPFLPRERAHALYQSLAAAAARTEFRW